MNHNQFLEQVIDDGIEAVKKDYTRPNQVQKRSGAIAGFEACRNKPPFELKALLKFCADATTRAYHDDKEKYWWYRCYEVEVEWVCNCVSAVLLNAGRSVIIKPTARGMKKAAEIVGVK